MNWLEFNWKFPDWQDKVLRALPEIRLFIAAQMQTNRGLLFDSEGSRNGHEKWKKPLFRNGMALSSRGTLRKSMGPMAKNKPITNVGTIVRFNGDNITIGTNLMIARLMNDGTKNLPGGKLVPVNAKALKIPLPGGKRATSLAKTLRKGSTKIKNKDGRNENVIFVKSVKIPERPFDTWSPLDQEEIETALMNKVTEVVMR